MKVGDKVKVKSWEEISKTLDDNYCCVNTKNGSNIYFGKDSMYQYVNLTGTISKIDDVTGNIKVKFKDLYSDWWWHPCWLDLIPKELTVDKDCSPKWLIFCMIFQYLSGNCPNPSVFKYFATSFKEEGGFNFKDFEYNFLDIQKGKIPFPDWPILNLPLDEAYKILEHCYKYGTCKRDLEFFTNDISTIIFSGFTWNSTPEGDIYWNDRLVNYKYSTSEKKIRNTN